ncbi:MAG TPA: choice-of-anchor tandem repeat GloVer-containing protein [Bryobacteraceae bacterium]|nr:choice-of-anchor tandem repeat GloVer-containing protein [Bryobacteraceae bacterium]
MFQFRLFNALTLQRACLVLLCCAAAELSPAQNYTYATLASFTLANGSDPVGNLVLGADGNLYGVTNVGGASNNGTVFKITLPSGAITTLHSFTGGADGANPTAGLVLGTDGNFYGTTNQGGSQTNNCSLGCGTVFKIAPGGAFTTLYTFQSGNDGFGPYTPLLQGKDGNFYGINIITLFEITPGGVLTPIPSNVDTNCSGCSANSLILGPGGDIYGTSAGGGNNDNGAVFQINFAGGSPTVTIVYKFCNQPNCTDGSSPTGPLVLGTDGNFYGVTNLGGNTNYGSDDGIVFKLTPAFQPTTLYSFCTLMNCADGVNPTGLMQASDGNFYGTTVYGGANNFGTIFKITSGGTLTTLYNFESQSFSSPQGADDTYETYTGMVLLQDSSGNFYGITSQGGDNGFGSVFRLSVPISIGAVTNGASFAANRISPGAIATIFGTSLATSTASSSSLPLPKTLGGASVTVNGTAVPLFYASPTQINFQVPYETAVGTASVIVSAGGASSGPFSTSVTAASPGIFQFGTNRAVAQNPNGSVNNTNNGVAAGSYIVAYLTGVGPLSNPVGDGVAAPSSPLSNATSSFSATLGGQNAPVFFLGLTPGFVGLAQANITIPQLSSGDYPLVITVNGVASNGPLITVGSDPPAQGMNGSHPLRSGPEHSVLPGPR